YSLWANDGNVTGKTADGGSFSGALGGTIVNNSLKGLFGAFYIRPNPLAGGNLCGYLLSKDITGTFYPGLGMFEADGTLSRGEREYETDVVPENLRDGVGIQYSDTSIGSIGRPGFSGSIEAESAKISDQDNWNLWRSSSGGSYTSPFPTGSWEADMGGWSFDEDSGNEATANSYWIGILKGETAGQVGEFSGEIDVTGLSESGISNSKGSLVGVYNNGIWEALSVGVSTDTNPLTSSGRFVAQGWNLGEGATFDFAGLIGLIGAIWSDVSHPEFISMGEFTPPHKDTPDKQFAWYVQKEWYYQGGGLAGEDGFVSRYDNGDGYTYTTYNDGSGVGNGVGSFYGLSAGVGGSGKLKGAIYSLYIDPAGDAGVLYGDVVGDYYADIKMYEMYSIEGMGLTKKFYNSVGILPANLRDNISWDTLSGLEDGGGFFGGGDINANGGSGNMLNIAGQEWGVWNLVTGGTYSGTTSDVWDIYDLTGMTVPGATSADTNYACGSWLGGFDGTKWSGGEVEGDVNAIWIVLGKDGTLSGRKLSGPLTGYYAEDEAGGSGTWQAGAAGEWVRPQDIIDGNQYSNLLAGPGMDSNIIALGGTNVPITVAYSSIMTGNNGILSATMNTSFYRMGESAADGIWAATITNGVFTSLPGTGWTLTMTDTTTNTTATLTGTKWEGSQWAALVSGNGSAANNVGEFTGQAAGTYTGAESGTFNGAATGTFTQKQTPPQYQ
ncbi:MAG: hypothetical protein NT036_03825, partial [Candidatus Omnitrophica bacterium]|nr:hypothetical protein [Candidatus Omnitrophota bacterium]